MKTDFPIHVLQVCKSLRFLPRFCFPVHCYSQFLALKVLTSSMFFFVLTSNITLSSSSLAVASVRN